MKVQNVNDSNEILKTPDAAAITQPGRAYLQVGNNEIYELFQSAYSGAPYMADIEVEDVRDNRIYEINELGQYELKTQDLSRGNIGKATIPELDAVVAEIKHNFEQLGDKAVPSPWLEPLGEFITQNQFEPLNVEAEWEKFANNHVVEQLDMVVGLTDEPQNQAQNVLKMNLLNGHIGIFGAGGFGKTIMIQSMMMSLARKNTPEAINFYVLDFGQALLPLKPLPHVADLITIDEEEKIGKWIRLMKNLIKKRKQIFKESGVADIYTYRDIVGESMNRVITILDNFDALKDSGFDDEFETVINMLAREGISLGLHLIIGASRSAAIKYQLMGNIKEKITFFQLDQNEISNIMGRTQMKLPEIPGRGIVKLDEFYEFQGLVLNNEETAVERISKLRHEVDTIRNMWKGEVPKSIPIVSEVLTMNTFLKYPTVQAVIEQPYMASVGLDFEKVESVTINFKETPLVQVLGNKKEITAIFMTIAKTMLENTDIYIIDSNQNNDLKKIENIKEIASSPEKWFEILKKPMRECLNCLERYDKDREKDINVELSTYTNRLPNRIVFVSDLEKFIDGLNSTVQQQFIRIFELADSLNLMFVFGSEVTNYNKVFGDLAEVVKKSNFVIAFSKVGDIPRMTVNQNIYREPVINKGEANVIEYGEFTKFKIVEVK